MGIQQKVAAAAQGQGSSAFTAKSRLQCPIDQLWPMLETVLKSNTKVAWFTGHSLGGAMATICAGRCLLSHISSTPKQLYTYGSPRVGNRRYINYCEVDYIRWVNNNDIVTRVPPSWLGYRHTGEERYLNARGLLRNVTGWQRTKDRWRGEQPAGTT